MICSFGVARNIASSKYPPVLPLSDQHVPAVGQMHQGRVALADLEEVDYEMGALVWIELSGSSRLVNGEGDSEGRVERKERDNCECKESL